MQRDWPSPQMTAECLTDQLMEFMTDFGEMGPAKIPDDDRHMVCVSHLRELQGEHLGSGCGIYLIPDRKDLSAVTHGFGSVDVQCIAWGTVAEYQVGYRAEKVRMEHIILDPFRVEQYLLTHKRKITVAEIDMLERELGYRYGVYVTWAT